MNREINMFLLNNLIEHRIIFRGDYYYLFHVNNIRCELIKRQIKKPLYIATIYFPSSILKPRFFSSIIDKIERVSLNDNYVFHHAFDDFNQYEKFIDHIKTLKH